jgi:hypothetical protein
VYFVRVRAANGAGVGPASNETIVGVGTGNVPMGSPSAPTNLISTVSGGTVLLQWNAVPSTSAYIVEAGSTPGLRDLAYVATGTPATEFRADHVAPGVYYVRVKGWAAAGVSMPSNEVTVVVR